MAARFRRVIIVVLDGVGVGALPDAAAYGDDGANTLLHVAEQAGPLDLPNLQRMGLGNICPAPGLEPVAAPAACWGRMAEASRGKDTTTGHWELAGLQTTEPFATYPHGFPDAIIDLFRRATGRDPLGNVAASGTEIIRDLGEEHLRSGRPIVYTSSDSVFQIAAHEAIVPPEQLYRICRRMRRELDPWRIGRVIARPFVGDTAENFTRTHRRHDYSMPPPAPTLLDELSGSGLPVVGIGKISDIFAGRGVDTSIPTAGNADGMEQLQQRVSSPGAGLVFCNLVDFDMLYGHRKDAAGFVGALARFDRWLPGFLETMEAADLLLVTADHGCDPTTSGTDHSREHVPVLAWHKGLAAGRSLGSRESFSDVAATAAEALGRFWPSGKSFLSEICAE